MTATSTSRTRQSTRELQESIDDLRTENDALLQAIWLIVKVQGGRVEVDEELLSVYDGRRKRLNRFFDEVKNQLVFEAQ